jgi:nitric-oxide synthase
MHTELLLTFAAGRKEALVDIAVSGLGGWVSVLGTSRKDMDIELRIYTPRGVEAFVRPPLPVPDPVQLQRARQ